MSYHPGRRYIPLQQRQVLVHDEEERMIDKKRFNEKGFTLVEILIVIVVIGSLASLALPRLMSQTDRFRLVEAINIMTAIRKAALQYYDVQGTFPSVGPQTCNGTGEDAEFQALGVDLSATCDGENIKDWSITLCGVNVLSCDPIGNCEIGLGDVLASDVNDRDSAGITLKLNGTWCGSGKYGPGGIYDISQYNS